MTTSFNTLPTEPLDAAVVPSISLAEFQQVLDQRQLWSNALRYIIWLIVVMDGAVIGLVGFNVLKFPTSPFALPTFIGSSMLEVYGLARLVIKFFFSNDFRGREGST